MGNIYQNIYDLIVNQLFGGSVEVGSNPELITILVSTFATIFLISVPFIIIYKFIKMVCNL